MPEPVAYFITWPTYGTWLPGDERGWVKNGEGWQLPNPMRELEAHAKMTEGACILDAEQRELVQQTITQHCQIRGWELHAVNCRTNHVHVVVTADRSPSEVRVQFKAWSTRRLKELEKRRGMKQVRENWWAERGSDRFINDNDSLELATVYVRDYQDDPERYRLETHEADAAKHGNHR